MSIIRTRRGGKDLHNLAKVGKWGAKIDLRGLSLVLNR